jgi:hypothetical protein
MVYLVVAIAFAALLFVGLVAARSVGKRRDDVALSGFEPGCTIPVSVTPTARSRIRMLFPDVIDVPIRSFLVANESGVELWSGPGDKLAELPWSRITDVRPTYVRRPRRGYAGIAVDLGDDRPVELALVGDGVLGLPTREQAARVAREIAAYAPDRENG